MITKNRKAYHEYNVIEKIEAGIVLEKWEAKAVRNNQLSLSGSYVVINNGNPILINANISPLSDAENKSDVNPTRSRNLLLHKREIQKLSEMVNEKGLTIIPLSAYLKNNKLKIEVGVAKGKNKGDKRHSLKEKAIKRDDARLSKSLKI
jgi:SsrA-binding protein